MDSRASGTWSGSRQMWVHLAVCCNGLWGSEFTSVVFNQYCDVRDRMLNFRYVGRAVNDRRNWPQIILAGAIVF